MWSKKFTKCIECGSTETEHQGYGLCRNCYMKKMRSEKPDIYKEMDKRYKQTPEYKAWSKEYESRPEVKERHRLASKKYRENNPGRMKEIQDRWEKNHPNAHLEYRSKPEIKLRASRNCLIRKYGEIVLVVLERDHYKCQKCGKDEHHIHHIDWDKKNNTPENMITLCNSCHKKLHSWVPIKLRRLIFDEWMSFSPSPRLGGVTLTG